MDLNNLIACFKQEYKTLKEEINQIYFDYQCYSEDIIQNSQEMHDVRITGQRMISDLGLMLGSIDQSQYKNQDIIKEFIELINKIDKLIL